MKRRKRRSSFKFVLVFAVLSLAVVFVLLSPIFNIQQVEIIGNAALTEREILDVSQIALGMNIFSFNARQATQRVLHLPYTATVAIRRELPNKVVINLQERVPMVNIATNYGYSLIDDTGAVLENAAVATSSLPTVYGLDHASTALYLFQVFAVYDFFPYSVDFSNPRNIIIYKNNFEINFGSTEEAQRKTRYIRSILHQVSLDGGFLDVSNPDIPIFRHSLQ